MLWAMKLGFLDILLPQALGLLGEDLHLGQCQCLCYRIGTWNTDEDFQRACLD